MSALLHIPGTTMTQVKVERILGLRHRILRAGLPIETAHFDGDELGSAKHFATFLADERNGEEVGEALCCATFMLNFCDGAPAWQVRGMATDAAHQGQGFGKHLILWAEGVLAELYEVTLFWCNARTSAVGFYEKLGWRVVSDEFIIPNAGPHRKMKKQL